MILTIDTTGGTVTWTGLEGHKYSVNTASMSVYPVFIQALEARTQLGTASIANRQARAQAQITNLNNQITNLNNIINATQSIV